MGITPPAPIVVSGSTIFAWKLLLLLLGRESSWLFFHYAKIAESDLTFYWIQSNSLAI